MGRGRPSEIRDWLRQDSVGGRGREGSSGDHDGGRGGGGLARSGTG